MRLSIWVIFDEFYLINIKYKISFIVWLIGIFQSRVI